MRPNPSLGFACYMTLLLAASNLRVSATPPADYHLVWSEEFDGTVLDPKKWGYYDLGARQDAVNTPDAVSLSNGCLVISTYTEQGVHYTGMISTRGKFEAVHGYWEARIKFADAPGGWSAFWLQSPTLAHPLGNPGVAGVEIDICEHRSLDKQGDFIADRVQNTLHWDGYGEHHQQRKCLTPPLNLNQGFHVYGCEVTSQGYTFFVDNKPTWTTNVAASNAREFVIFSSEIKNKWWSGPIPEHGYGSRQSSRVKMLVDYVRYYQREK
jgi:beta-glucanase (GH16 family)